MMATLFDGIARHTREGLNFKRRAAEEGWKRAVEGRDQGSFDWIGYALLAQNCCSIARRQIHVLQ
jgi:enoyl-CoA hydratase